MPVKQNLFVSVFFHKCLMILNNVEYTTFKMFVTQMSSYFLISFQLMFYKTLRYQPGGGGGGRRREQRRGCARQLWCVTWELDLNVDIEFL